MSDTVGQVIAPPAIVQRRLVSRGCGKAASFCFGGTPGDRHGWYQNMDTVHIEVWLYGPIARYAGEKSQGSYAHLLYDLPAGTTMRELLDLLQLPDEEKGITFINGSLADLPGLASDREVVLQDGDRVGITHRKSMWPFQYRFGASQTDNVQETFRGREDRGIHHAYTKLED